MDGLTTLETEGLAAGSATFSTTGLGAGPHAVTAVYSGDATFGGSQSGGGTIATIAGNGIASFAGDSGQATSAELHSPTSVALSPNGDLFIADALNNRIREVNAATGVITTVAGTGVAGYSGNGGPATSAELNDPIGVALDLSGNIYIADSVNNVIREVHVATGVITTVAGDHTPGNHGDGGAATAAELFGPTGIAVDSSGNLFIADTNNGVIREVSAATGKIATVAGTGNTGSSGDGGPATAAKLNLPQGVAVDSSGNLFIADTGNSKVREVSAATGNISTVVGNGVAGESGNGGPATSAELNAPITIAIDSAGNIFIADSNNNEIREVSAATGKIAVVAGNGTLGYHGDGGPPLSAELDQPTAVAVTPSGNLYITDRLNSVIRKVSTIGQNVTVNPAQLTITASPETMVAGQAVPPLTASYSGFVNGDTAARLTSQPVLTTTATTASSAGAYSIDVSGAASPNYHITFVNGTITVKPPVTVTGPPPTVVVESVVITQKHNNKGKKIGKPILSGYTITFSTAMDQTALGSHASYEMDVKSIKTKVITMGHKKIRTKVTVLSPIAFSVSKVTSNSVTLSLAGKQTFPKGGEIKVFHNGVDDTSGVFLAQDAILTISPKGKSIS